jgi:hypothetical protein
MPTDEADVVIVRIRSCNRLCRQANPPGNMLANWWRRAGWPLLVRRRP